MTYRVTTTNGWSTITRTYEASDVKAARVKAKKTLQPDEWVLRIVGEDGVEYK